MTTLDLYRIRFSPGIHLLEASAGTGKTYSIAQLVVRFIVEEGIGVEEMGVVTFTRAATAELRQRIHQRLCQVRDRLAGRNGNDGDDQALNDWIAGLADPETARKRVAAELLKLDLMPIQTIHSFCQHALRQQALEAGELLGQTLLEDDRAFSQAIVDDFWRCQLQTLSQRHWRRILQRTATPDDLAGLILSWQPPVKFVPEVDLPEPMKVALEPSEWQRFSDWMDWLCGAKYFNSEARQWWQRLRSEEGMPERLAEVKLRTDLLAFLQRQLSKSKVKPAQLDNLPRYQDHRHVLEALADLARRQAGLEIAWLRQAWKYWRDEYERRLRQQGLLTHDWVVRRLAQVVSESPIPGLQNRFRLFFIDEFQDTDRHQWQIFSRLFGTGDHWLFLIGDPKQSIYRFRGADLDTYFLAAGQAQRVWRLGTNYRFHPDLLQAINLLFQDEEATRLEQTPFYHPHLHYHPVAPGCDRNAMELQVGGRPMTPLMWQAFSSDAGPYRYSNQTRAIEQLARHASADIVALLEHATLIDQGLERQLQPGDIAVLVRSNETARILRDALRERRVPAVLIDRRSVCETDTAQKLYRLLATLWEGATWDRVKRVLADGWFGCDARDVAAIDRDDHTCGEWLSAFADAGARWREDSLLAAVEELFRRFGVWQTIAAQRFGARTLADLRHLLEMLQDEATRRQLGPQALLTWYRRRLDSPASEADQLRLESDADAVELVTMHSAKGLEYPVVLCFDLWLPEKTGRNPDPVVVADDHGIRVVFQIEMEAYQQALEVHRVAERQESLRVAYVALTRAKAHCRVYLVEKEPGKNGPLWSPIRHLLTRRQGGDVFAGAESLARDFPDRFCFQVRPWEDVPQRAWQADQVAPRLTKPRPLRRQLASEARVLTSYSALVRGRTHLGISEWIERLLDEGVGDEESQLPKGTAFGNLLHALLEKAPFTDLSQGRVDMQLWEHCRRQAGFGEALQWQEVMPLLQRAVTTPLPEFSLAQVDPDRQLHELAFFLPLRSFRCDTINRMLRGQPWFRPLHFAPVRGFLRGFIDLVVEHGQRFYVIDYKSNELDDYGEASLEAAMWEHDYGFQAILYALALHRYLKRRLPGYEFSKHFGGVRYLFLRGMTGEAGRGIYRIDPSLQWMTALEAMLAHGAEAA